MDRKIVIIPTYNEKENIANIIRAVFDLKEEFHILVIEDGSPDGTAAIVKRMQEEFPQRLHMIERQGKLGLGTAYITGFKWCVEKGYDYIFEMDADFSHNPEDLPRLYEACSKEGADLAIGSRYCNGISVIHHLCNITLRYEDGTFALFLAGDYRSLVQKNCPAHACFGLIFLIFSFITPQKASPNIPLLIFEVPSFLSTKMIGTSLILNPSL